MTRKIKTVIIEERIPYQLSGDIWRYIFSFLSGQDLINVSKALTIKIKPNTEIINKIRDAKMPKVYKLSNFLDQKVIDKNKPMYIAIIKVLSNEIILKKCKSYYLYDILDRVYDLLEINELGGATSKNWIKRITNRIKHGDILVLDDSSIFPKTYFIYERKNRFCLEELVYRFHGPLGCPFTFLPSLAISHLIKFNIDTLDKLETVYPNLRLVGFYPPKSSPIPTTCMNGATGFVYLGNNTNSQVPIFNHNFCLISWRV